MSGSGQTPTRAALLEMLDEQVVVNEAYVFLDEKRLLLAAELLRQLGLYQKLRAELSTLHDQAKKAMLLAVKHHGLDGLQVYPSASLEGLEYKSTTRNFMGVILVEAELIIGQATEHGGMDHRRKSSTVANPSIKADNCARLLKDSVLKSGVLAGLSGNLYRLLSEYRLTERRSRALESVILPEIEQNLRAMTSHLEELDLEDAVRVHLQSRSRL